MKFLFLYPVKKNLKSDRLRKLNTAQNKEFCLQRPEKIIIRLQRPENMIIRLQRPENVIIRLQRPENVITVGAESMARRRFAADTAAPVGYTF